MPINNTPGSTNTTANVPDNGDVLAQLAANQANTKDLYLLEKGMSNTLSKIEKNQSSVTTVLTDIRKLMQSGNKVLSSVDTSLKDFTHKLNNVVDSLNKLTNSNTLTQSTNIPNTTVDLSGVLSRLDIISNDQLNRVVDSLNQLTSSNTSTQATNTPDVTVDLREVLSRLDTISNNQLNSVNQNNAGSNINTPTELARILTLMEQQSIDVMDTKSYVNDCSSYLDEIRELLRNIDDRGENLVPNSTGTPVDDATRIDSLADINDTLLQILDELQYSNFINMQNDRHQRSVVDNSNDANDIGSQIQNEYQEAFRDANADWEALLESVERERQLDESRRSTLRTDATDAVDGLLSNVLGDNYNIISKESLDTITKSLNNWGNGKYITGDVINGVGSVVGDLAGGAIATSINAVVPGLGSIIGNAIDKTVTKAFNSLSEYLSYIINKANANRDTILKESLDKIRKDVTAMATYGIDIQKASLDKIYNAWDQNLSTVNATQGYTKEALNSLQDAVAQRLQREGYSTAINAADFSTQLVNTLNAKLGGPLAEAFAAQNLILQKAVPELDLSGMAAEFAAIYTNAQKQGTSGEAAMIDAMNQIAGATKALEQVTGGNNQFITQVGSFLKKAEEVVNRSDGTADQIASLTTQMMAAEAPLAALVPQLSGFTTTMVDTLMKGNDATAVALRSIMHDINENVGVSATAFMESFVSDTQGTLATAYQAIDRFISQNENSGARQEFLLALQDVFGLQADQVAQIDFAQIADEITRANTQTNIQALTAAENLLRSGETTTWEDQLVNNTTNQLLATNAVRDTIDNKLMRKLEQNELELERAVYQLQATQTVDFAEKTLAFFTNIFDVVQKLIDPFGLFDGITSILDVMSSDYDAKANYNATFTASQIGSTVTSAMDEFSADVRTQINGWGMAQNIAVEALTTKSTENVELQVAMLGIADTYPELLREHKNAVISSTNAASDRSLEMATAALESQQQQVNQQQQLLARSEVQYANIQAQQAAEEAARKQQQQTVENQKELDNKKLAAAQQQRALLEAERAMTTANHDNIEAIRESVSKLDELSNYLSPILDENRNQSGLLQTLSEKFDQLIQAVTTKITQPAVVSPTPNVNTSYNEHNRIYGPIKTW